MLRWTIFTSLLAFSLSFVAHVPDAHAQGQSDRWYKRNAKKAVSECLADAKERNYTISAALRTVSTCFAGGFITEVTFSKERTCRKQPCSRAPVQLLATVEFGCDDTIHYKECNWKTCTLDTDCDTTVEWCQTTEYGVGECHPYVGAGESCEGFTLPWHFERCEPGLQCVTDPQIPDLMGVCATCNDEGEPYMEGETFLSSDGCNTCTCQANGLLACTKMACINPCVTAGCSGQLCVDASDAGIITTCEYRPEYQCLQYTTCGENGPGGSCAWADTKEYQSCLNNLPTLTTL